MRRRTNNGKDKSNEKVLLLDEGELCLVESEFNKLMNEIITLHNKRTWSLGGSVVRYEKILNVKYNELIRIFVSKMFNRGNTPHINDVKLFVGVLHKFQSLPYCKQSYHTSSLIRVRKKTIVSNLLKVEKLSIHQCLCIVTAIETAKNNAILSMISLKMTALMKSINELMDKSNNTKSL